MITFFVRTASLFYAVEHTKPFGSSDVEKLEWLFEAKMLQNQSSLEGCYVGPRPEMITPWSTNAVEITQNMNIEGIERIEELFLRETNASYDTMLQNEYTNPGQDIFSVEVQTAPIQYIEDLESYNESEGLALSPQEIEYLRNVEKRLGRPLTDSEVFGFSQVNSEHCRHKIFNGTFVIDGKEQPQTLFGMIKSTTKTNPNRVVSAYKDNVAFVEGNPMQQFAPLSADKPDFFALKERDTVISIKAETHNFPTTVEPFNGAATGTGGEIRDRMSGGKASIPVAGTAVYMTSYHRLGESNPNVARLAPRKWLYQTPQEILTKASNGASDFGNKFGQPLINGSLLTYEHKDSASDVIYGYDKVIMQAGGIGYATKEDAQKEQPQPHETVVVMGGDNYRIGMGGGAVSSVNTGQYSSGIELNAVQRANPEMQKRVQNVVRALSESDHNPIISIHDHGAGGHLNSLTELIEETGGNIDIDQLPIGDPSLSAKEILGNESQERMGLLIREEDYAEIERIAQRERAPIYKVGETTDDKKLLFRSDKHGAAIDLRVEDFLGNSPTTIITDESHQATYTKLTYNEADLETYVDQVLQLDSVACKDWLTNKVDRSVTGKVARQQCVGALQLPLADLGAIAQDYTGNHGIATSLGHAPRVGLISPESGSRIAIAEALTNLVFAPLDGGLRSVSLSANWMWPCKNQGEDARLYKAVEACAQFAKDLGINIPTGKDSLSMTQKYPDGTKVVSPGTVIITAAAPTGDVRKIVTPCLTTQSDSAILYIDMSRSPLSLGGSAFAQVVGQLGDSAPTVADSNYFAQAFGAIQNLIEADQVIAGHDISDGGLLVALLEMAFPSNGVGAEITLASQEGDLVTRLFAENPGVLLQVRCLSSAREILDRYGVQAVELGRPTQDGKLTLHYNQQTYCWNIADKRDIWYHNSYLLECFQTEPKQALERYTSYKEMPLRFAFPASFDGKMASLGLRKPLSNERKGITAAILRDKGTNGDREMAYSLHLAGFDVKDVHLTDLISGREDLTDVSMLVFCGGFSNSDVLGSAKGWAGGILYNEKARKAVFDFYDRPDTLSLGICNGCQLMAELGLLYPEHEKKHRMAHNLSGKFESGFVSLRIPQNDSVMFGSLSGCELGVWVAHGEGRFDFPYPLSSYQLVAQYSYDRYPANPNGSPEAVAGICSPDGRHLAMMPHLERSIFPWQCAYYPNDTDEVTPWIVAFRNAYTWIEKKIANR